jgi:hypothetical protein
MQDATFHFAWVDPTETTFSAGTHAREDEQVFGLTIAQTEGEFATAEVEIQNPGEGLLASGRKQHVWLSVTREGTTTALMFGRVTGFPRNTEGEVVTLEFVAQFPDWQTTRATLFATLKALPYWDPAFIPAAELDNPDQALEGRPQLYHYRRTSPTIALSHILTGGSTLTVTNHFEDSLRFEVTDTLVRSVTVTATVEWEQRLTGDSTRAHYRIKREFPGGVVSTFTGPGFASTWPQVGDSIGGQTGYEVIQSRIRQIAPLPGSMAGTSTTFKAKVSDGERGFVRAIRGQIVESRDAVATRYWFSTNLVVAYNFRQARRETITFTVVNDVQAITDSDAGAVTIDLRAEDLVGLSLLPAAYSSYFLTARGKQSFEHLLARARATLAAGCRSIEIGFAMPFFDALAISCDHSITIPDARLPGGTATGKVKSYRLIVDGDAGTAQAEITLGVAIGNGASASADGTENSYVEDGYVEDGYQIEEGESAPSAFPELVYQPYGDQLPTDPTIISRLRNDDIVQSVTVTNGPVAQETLLLANQYPVRDNALQAVNQAPTEVALTLRALEPADDLSHTITVTIVHPWPAPQGIDLAA